MPVPNESAPASPGSIPTVAFVLFDFRPGECGVTDYCLRMACALQAGGTPAALLTFKTFHADLWETSEGTVPIATLGPPQASEFSALSIQYTPNVRREGREFLKSILKCHQPKAHLMIHEIWRVSTADHTLTLRERVTGVRQAIQLLSFLRRLRPASIGTSNRLYFRILENRGIPIGLSPMPSNIPSSPPGTHPLPPCPWLARMENEFIWVTFGSLYGKFWNMEGYLAAAAALPAPFASRQRWIICGRQNGTDIQSFRQAAAACGLDGKVSFTGSLTAAEVDAYLQHADAFFTGNSEDFWEKSGGVLAAVERGLPIHFARNAADNGEKHKELLLDFMAGLPQYPHGGTGIRTPYDGPHRPDHASSRLLEQMQLGSPNPAH